MLIAFRKQRVVMKNPLESPYTHYTIDMGGTSLNIHQTFERERRHVPIIDVEFSLDSDDYDDVEYTYYEG
jgi:hypothetical protein